METMVNNGFQRNIQYIRCGTWKIYVVLARGICQKATVMVLYWNRYSIFQLTLYETVTLAAKRNIHCVVYSLRDIMGMSLLVWCR